MTELIRRYKIYLPAQAGMLIRLLVLLEGTGKLLNPKFSLASILKNFQKKLLRHRLSIKHYYRRFRKVSMELGRLAEKLPAYFIDIIDKFDKGRLDVHLQHRGMEPSINRLVLGMLTSALFLGSALMLSRNVPPLMFQQPTVLGLHNVSVMGLAGVALSMLLGLRLLRAIGKSGHLDRQKRND